MEQNDENIKREFCEASTISEYDKAFKDELISLLNRYSWDDACDTPDYVLADYLERCLMSYCSTIRRTIAWHSDWKRLGEEDKK